MKTPGVRVVAAVRVHALSSVPVCPAPLVWAQDSGEPVTGEPDGVGTPLDAAALPLGRMWLPRRSSRLLHASQPVVPTLDLLL